MYREVKLFLMSKVQCVLCFEYFTTEGEGEKGVGVQILKHNTEPLTSEIISPLYY